MDHVVAGILSTITVYSLTDEWFLLWLLFCLPLLFKVYTGVVHVVVAILSTITVYSLTDEWILLWWLYFLPLLFKVLQREDSCCGCFIIYHYCLQFDR